MGRHVIDERNREYIKNVTIDNREMLDPSGRAARIDPSQITSFPDYSFGLGHSSRITPSNMKSITEKIRQKLDVDKNDLGEYQRMIGSLQQYAIDEKNQNSDALNNTYERSQSAPAGDVQNNGATSANNIAANSQEFDKKAIELFNTLGGQRGDMPGKSAVVSVVNAQPEGEMDLLLKIAQDENGGASINGQGSPMSTLSPKYTIREQSKFEKDSLDRAKKSMKQRREDGVVQVAAGKVFKGEAFVSSPAVLEYKDFQVGHVYKKRFTLTNVSYSFNSFQLLPLKDDIIDFFEIVYEKPGRMSAGVSCHLDIIFSPKINEDIFGQVQLLSQTGPINIPLKCLKRRCVPRVLTEEVKFEDVIIGQIVKKKITIKNTGALGTKFTVFPADAENANAVGDAEINSSEDIVNDSSPKYYGYGDAALNDNELSSRVRLAMTEVLRRKKKDRPNALCIEASPGTNATMSGPELVSGEIEGYSTIALDVICAPLTLGQQSRKYLVRFDEVKDKDYSLDEAGIPVTQKQLVDLSVNGEDLPVYLASDNIDLKCVAHNRLYRTRFELRNRGKSSYRVDVNIPTPMNKFLETSPNSVYVQAGGSQIVNIKFLPSIDLIQSLTYFTLPVGEFENTSKMSLPIEIKVCSYIHANDFVTHINYAY